MSPSALVNPFMGTGVGGTAVGNIDDSPAADVPFGMMQWGPDTAPDRAKGGGYSFGDTAISGFSLTHLNGPGCAALGDVPILPTVGAVAGAPERDDRPRSRTRDERAAPGRVRGRARRSGRCGSTLAVTTRSGIAALHVPAAPPSANLLFKVADSAVAGATAPTPRSSATARSTGSVVSGQLLRHAGHLPALVRRAVRPSVHARSRPGGQRAVRPGAANGDGPHSGADAHVRHPHRRARCG